ncbi:MAG: Gfo/Idh/MocA family oxidoreductase [Isosphaeraceae bacterium]
MAEIPRSPSPGHSRRRFLGQAAALGLGFRIVPRHVLGGAGFVAPSEKVTLAFVGVGSQGLRVMLNFLKQPDVQAVAVCDPNRASADYPQWSPHEFAGAVHELLGLDSGWDWLSPDQPIALTRSRSGTGGVAGREPARKIVEAYQGREKGSGAARGCAAFADFRELLERQRDLDAVVVGTPDHLHAAVALEAIRKGKHVFCQKPMAHTVSEARRMAEEARRAGVATQVAVMNQSSEDTRRLCEWVAAGAIGPVRQVLNWSSRPFWAQARERPRETPPVPEGLDWDLWLGPAAGRPYHPAYLPFVWRGWQDFGTGALGDMGQYSFDTIFRVLRLEAPTRVEASSTERFAETFPAASIVHYDFPARGELPPVRLSWYDGGLRPPRPDVLGEADEPADEGLLFLGDDGAILCDFNGRRPRLLPESRRKTWHEPAATLPRSPGTLREWLDACKGGEEKPGARFEVSAPAVEALLLGNVALKAGRAIGWDPAGLKVKGDESAQSAINPERRGGWAM